MSISEVKLNLARKWRSRNFQEIIGQDLSIRMLKNSLFREQYFPVYLFSGQRGCGKTTTARVFAAALNCEQLESFQKSPQGIMLPCLDCKSCVAMHSGKHPDFIEIDAASHTGVDNVRYIVDSASLLPLMGRKKVYLIDEAHMLSKAAFNAFLKILEEPPASVIFILATTDVQKIIETVRSRCFQLFFKPIASATLMGRLKEVCAKEEIAYEDAGLSLIIKQTEGSARDALNLLEQVRFSHASVSYDAVLGVLGFMDDESLIGLFETALLKSPQELIQYIHAKQWQQYSARMMWGRFIELGRSIVWFKYGVSLDSFSEHAQRLQTIINMCSANQILYVLDVMYKYESAFLKTLSKHELFEMVLLRICQRNKRNGGGTGSPAQVAIAPFEEVSSPNEDDLDEDEDQDDDELEEDALNFKANEPSATATLASTKEISAKEPSAKAVSPEERWDGYVDSLSALEDPMIRSVFKQAVVKNFDIETRAIIVEFSKDFIFFKDWLQETSALWMPLLQKQFGENVRWNPLFTGPVREKKQKERVVAAVSPAQQPAVQKTDYPQRKAPERAPYQRHATRRSYGTYKPFAAEVVIDVSDSNTWKIASLVAQHLPGSITEVRS